MQGLRPSAKVEHLHSFNYAIFLTDVDALIGMKPFQFPIVALWVAQALGQDTAQSPLHNEDQTIGDVPRVVSKDLDEFIERIREEWHAPGLAVAIVDGNNTWAKVKTPSPFPTSRGLGRKGSTRTK